MRVCARTTVRPRRTARQRFDLHLAGGPHRHRRTRAPRVRCFGPMMEPVRWNGDPGQSAGAAAPPASPASSRSHETPHGRRPHPFPGCPRPACVRLSCQSPPAPQTPARAPPAQTTHSTDTPLGRSHDGRRDSLQDKGLAPLSRLTAECDSPDWRDGRTFGVRQWTDLRCPPTADP
jgi:hypothetical protein